MEPRSDKWEEESVAKGRKSSLSTADPIMSQCDGPGTSLVFVDGGTADRCSRVNSEMYRSILFAHIQTNLIERDFTHQHSQAWLYVCAVVKPSRDKGGSVAVNVIWLWWFEYELLHTVAAQFVTRVCWWRRDGQDRRLLPELSALCVPLWNIQNSGYLKHMGWMCVQVHPAADTELRGRVRNHKEQVRWSAWCVLWLACTVIPQVCVYGAEVLPGERLGCRHCHHQSERFRLHQHLLHGPPVLGRGWLRYPTSGISIKTL